MRIFLDPIDLHRWHWNLKEKYKYKWITVFVQLHTVIQPGNRVHLRSRLILSVASKLVHVGKKHVLIGCKSNMFWRQTFEVWRSWLLLTWFVFAQQNQSLQDFQTLRIIFGGKCGVSEREMWLKVVKNEIWVERVDQKQINNLPLAWQFALTAVKIQMFGDKTRHV